ncbi:MAG: VCBS repeat-containing protein [Planctomycetota bacterium]
MSSLQRVLGLAFVVAQAIGQQMLWQIPATLNSGYRACWSFGDYNRDGCRDVLAYQSIGLSSSAQINLSILSGRDGTVLHLNPLFYGIERPSGAGDFDGDGYDEYIWFTSFTIHIYSPRRNVELVSIAPIGSGEFGWALEPRIDLDGDGRSDILSATVRSFDSSLYAYDHLGSLRYVIPASIHGWAIQSIVNVGDRDGDGGEDFLVGALGGVMAEGGAFLYSGRTGTLLRYHPGLQAYDALGGYVAVAGDLDLDGVSDYLASSAESFFSLRQVTVAWSGADGAVLRVWQDPTFNLGHAVHALHDADLDGAPDVLFACGGCQPAPFVYGAVQVASSRDGFLLGETHTTLANEYGTFVADLGVQPGNPHPVHALAYMDVVQNGGTIQAWRSEPRRSNLSGSACTNLGTAMIPGFRATPTGSRLQIANAPPGSLAWCILGDGVATTTGGLPLPIGLDGFGFPGCSLLVPVDFVGAKTTGVAGIDRGYAAFDLPVVPATTGGRRFAVQWLVLDPATGLEVWTARRDFWLR